MNTLTTPTNPIESSDPWRPVAYVAMQDRAARQRIVNVLERARWAVIPQPSGFHLIRAIAGVIDGHRSWLRPGLIVVDARSRGCAGTTIAAGLRDLGITIPIVLIAAPDETLPVSPDRTLRIVDSASAEKAVAELAMSETPARPILQ
jgi:FixJ family two-component response regulator